MRDRSNCTDCSVTPPSGVREVSACADAQSASDATIERVVDRLVLVHRAATLQLALDVGAIVVNELYGGDANLLRDRGEKDYSLRKLAAHPRLPFSPSTLWRSIGIYEIVRREPELVRWEHLRVSHFRAVLGLPPERQIPLLREAAIQERSAAWVTRRASDLRSKAGRDTGSVDMTRTVRRVEELARACALPGSASPASLAAQERAAIERSLRDVKNWCLKIENWLGASRGTEFDS